MDFLTGYWFFGSLPILALQIFLAVHAVRTGRFYWLFIIFFFPLVGSLVYLFAEYLPSARAGRSGLSTVTKTVKKVLDPGAEIRRLEDQLSLTDTHDNRVALGRAYRQAGRLDDAIRMYESSLEGMYSDAPRALSELSVAYYLAGRLGDARATFDRLRRARQPTAEELTISGRIAEDSGDLELALREYTAAAPGAGAEARCRQGLVLKRLGRDAEAMRAFEEILRHARVSPGHYRKAEKEWIDIAQRETKGAGAAR
ncbi:MAG TPA: tetratricopeptide repeat protein [Longimicrobium sp.]|jgi:hypothetical protein|uniref:tetratricopeptide repeat protein n=1 Tax=Longimicrobium sp. TaxID=2029185 RepID=UPI002ED8D255